MKIEDFILKSEGSWKSMRSSHILTFQKFEEIHSLIDIKLLSHQEQAVQNLIESMPPQSGNLLTPFHMKWEAESDWEQSSHKESSSGSCLLIPISKSPNEGVFIKSNGYAECIPSISQYQLSKDGTIELTTRYEKTIAQEKIWFASKNLRCRASLIKIAESSGILQTSYASEIRQLNKSEE